MSKTQVTMKLELFDVQLIADALFVYAEFMKTGADYVGVGANERLVTVPLYNGSSAYCLTQAQRLKAEIGLRTGEQRAPQLEMWGDERVEQTQLDEGVTAAEDTGDGEDVTAAEDGHLIAEVILKTADDPVPVGLHVEPAG